MIKSQIEYIDFSKLDLRIGQVTSATEVEGSIKLLELRVDFGPEIGQRTIYAGVREWQETGKITGRKLAFVLNLAPKTFKIGKKEYVSEGMLIAADPGGKTVLYTFDEDLPPGSILK